MIFFKGWEFSSKLISLISKYFWITYLNILNLTSFQLIFKKNLTIFIFRISSALNIIFNNQYLSLSRNNVVFLLIRIILPKTYKNKTNGAELIRFLFLIISCFTFPKFNNLLSFFIFKTKNVNLNFYFERNIFTKCIWILKTGSKLPVLSCINKC